MTDNSAIDILSLDKQIKKIFQKQKENLQFFKKQKYQLENTSVVNTTSHIQNNIRLQIKKIESIINDINTDNNINFYIMETMALLDDYQKIINKPIVINFLSNNTHYEQDTKKQQIIRDYLNIYNKYKNNTNYLTISKNKNCPLCQSTDLSIDDSELICKSCGNTTQILLQNSSYKDSERINIIPKYTYDRKSHFRDCINQYQGKQVVNIADSVYEDLIKQFKLNRLLVGDENTPKKIRFQNITKKHIQMFLKETKNSKHYEDITYIYHYLTEKQVKDISAIERFILEDFDILTETYDKLYKNNKNKNNLNRKSFINSQYVLYQLLRKYNHPCDKEDFNILKTSDRQNFHDEVCRELFKHLGWNFKCIF